MLRVIHTADWHLGHNLHGISRDFEHQQFLDWLLLQLAEQQAQALIIAGDIFDTANPSATALHRLYTFLVTARQQNPALAIIVVGGNHDSPSRLEAPNPVLAALGIHLIAQIHSDDERVLQAERLLVPLKGDSGEVEAWCGAMPFLRPFDLPPANTDSDDPLIDGVQHRYRELCDALQARCDAGQAQLLTGHLYMVASQISELSERKILGGNQHALPLSIFPESIDYVALGHLHLAQKVGDSERVRYSGSPIPLSLAEANYPHQVRLLTFEQGALQQSQRLVVPRSVDMWRVPKKGAANLQDILTQLTELPFDESLEKACWPFLEIEILLEKPEPTARQQIEDALDDKPIRLLKVTPRYARQGGTLAQTQPHKALQDLHAEDVFRSAWQRHYSDDISDEVLDCFRQIVEQVEGENS